MSNYKEFKKQLLKDKEIAKAYKNLGPEFAVVKILIKNRLKQGITQKELAKRAHTQQPVISRLERGDFSPSLEFLYRITQALGAKMEVSIS
jgi:predicted transcriptional regulator